MEKITISKPQEQKLLSLFKKRDWGWIAFLIIGVGGLFPIGVTYFSDFATKFYSSPAVIFLILGIVLLCQNEEAKKKIKKRDYQVYKAECKKVHWEYASVENNEILSKKAGKSMKKIAVLGSVKSINVGDEIGILKTGKEFWIFPLNS